jgi:hypothetical protein
LYPTCSEAFFDLAVANCEFLLIFVPLSSNGLSCGVMVTQQILVLSFQVRVLAAQLKPYFGNKSPVFRFECETGVFLFPLEGRGFADNEKCRR